MFSSHFSHAISVASKSKNIEIQITIIGEIQKRNVFALCDVFDVDDDFLFKYSFHTFLTSLSSPRHVCRFAIDLASFRLTCVYGVRRDMFKPTHRRRKREKMLGYKLTFTKFSAPYSFIIHQRRILI